MWRICIKRVTGQYSRDRQREYRRMGGAPLTDIGLEILQTHFEKIRKLENHYNKSSRGCRD